MHAASSIAAVTGAWQYKGGGAFHNNGAIYHIDMSMIEGHSLRDPSIRMLDQSRFGPVVVGDPADLGDGPPITALHIQNTNPAQVCPEVDKAQRGLRRADLFTCVHEQFMTDTARLADIVLPATTFLEHDDFYKGGGHQYIIAGPKLIEPYAEARENHWVNSELARRLGAHHEGFDMSAAELADWTLKASGWPGWDDLKAGRWQECQPDFDTAHYVNGFANPDGKFHFSPDWSKMGPHHAVMPKLPDHLAIIEQATPEHPFRMVTAPSRGFLNSSFNETPSSLKREGRPALKVHPDDLAMLGLGDGQRIRIGNRRGSVVVHAVVFDGVQPGVVIHEGIWPNGAFEEGLGINCLVGADVCPPNGGAAFHDTAIWIKAA
jgi:anaerobic selenocysteine-containing dehydrogenase